MSGLADHAILESLLLDERLPAPLLLYVLKRHAAMPEHSLLELCVGMRLIEQTRAAELKQQAEAALKAAGAAPFNFTKGALVGPWELGEERGTGLGGSHSVARHESTGQHCLLRLVQPALPPDGQRLQRLEERANAGAEPPHPGILKIDEVGEDFGWLYSVTHDFDGWNLSSRLQQGSLLETEAIPLMRTVAEALKVAHGFQVVHGGITPLSLIMSPEGRILLSDFGVGSVVMDGPASGQRPGGRLGMLLYSAPEMISGNTASGVDPRSDIFSLGTIIYDCVLRADSSPETNANYPWRVAPPISEAFKIVLARAMSPDLSSRYGAITELLADLARVGDGTTPGTLSPPPATPAFLGPRASTAGPQKVATAEVIKAGAVTESEAEIMARSQAGEDFLAAIAAGQAPSDSDVGYHDEAPAAGAAPAPAPGPGAPAAPAPAPKTRPKTGKLGKGPGKSDSEKSKSKSGSNTGVRKRSTTRRPTPSKRVSSTSAPSRRSRTVREGSSISLGSVLIFLICIGGIGGGAFAAIQHSALPPADLAVRLTARATYYAEPSQNRFSEALDAIDEALRIIGDGPSSQRLREKRREVLARSVDFYQGIRGQLVNKGAPTKEQKEQLDEMARRLAGTPAALILAVDEIQPEDTGNDALAKLTELADKLFEAGLAGESVKALERAVEINKTSIRLKKRLAMAEVVAANMVYVPGDRIVIEEGRSPEWVGAFYLDRVEVSRGRWKAFLTGLLARAAEDKGLKPADYKPKGWQGDDEPNALPVTGVTWDNAAAFAKAEGLRLPTEAEFRIACRGPGRRTFPWGDTAPSLYRAATAAHFDSVVPVGSFPAGAAPSGALDLIGNSAEWCDGEGETRPVRGGSIKTPVDQLAIDQVVSLAADTRREDIGFRCAVEARLPR